MYISGEATLTVLIVLASLGDRYLLRKIIQSTLVISTSVISNNRLSRRENLVLVITQISKIDYKILWKRGEIAPGEQFLPFSTIFQYILLIKGVKLHSHL